MKNADSGLLAQLGEVNFLLNRKISNISSLGKTLGKIEILSQLRKLKSKEEIKVDHRERKEFMFFEVNDEAEKEEMETSGLEVDIGDDDESDEEE